MYALVVCFRVTVSHKCCNRLVTIKTNAVQHRFYKAQPSKGIQYSFLFSGLVTRTPRGRLCRPLYELTCTHIYPISGLPVSSKDCMCGVCNSVERRENQGRFQEAVEIDSGRELLGSLRKCRPACLGPSKKDSLKRKQINQYLTGHRTKMNNLMWLDTMNLNTLKILYKLIK